MRIHSRDSPNTSSVKEDCVLTFCEYTVHLAVKSVVKYLVITCKLKHANVKSFWGIRFLLLDCVKNCHKIHTKEKCVYFEHEAAPHNPYWRKTLKVFKLVVSPAGGFLEKSHTTAYTCGRMFTRSSYILKLEFLLTKYLLRNENSKFYVTLKYIIFDKNHVCYININWATWTCWSILNTCAIDVVLLLIIQQLLFSVFPFLHDNTFLSYFKIFY